jgi:hypothetical protein
MKTTIGTNHFFSLPMAHSYYKGYIGGNVTDSEINQLVQHKIDNEEIVIGKPLVQTGVKLQIIDGRYHIEG